MAMVENLQYEYPIGNNGETSFPNVVRGMFPNASGTTLSSNWTSGEVRTYTFKGIVPSYVRDKTQLNFVAFIQRLSDKYVEQSAITTPFTFSLDLSAVSLNGQFANCNASQYTPSVNIANVGLQTVNSCYIYEYLDGNLIDGPNYALNLPGGNSISQTLGTLNLSPGVHNISVTITSPNFTADPNPANNVASMIIDIAQPTVNTPLVDGFENGDPTVNDGWAVEDVDHDSTWRVVPDGHNSAHSEMVDFIEELANDFVGASNNLYTPPLNLTYISHATVKFDYANQLINFGNNEYGGDSLYIDVSSDCGATWNTVYANGFTAMATAPAQNYGNTLTNFVPTNSQWKTDSADISVVANNNNVLLRFRPTTLDGNNFYLDNVNITTADSVPYTPPTAITPVASGIQSLNVYPNPANTTINVVLQLDKAAEVSYRLTDVTGI